MSLKPQTFDPVPAETARITKAAFPQGNTYIQMRDVFGTLYTDEAFAPLFASRGQPAMAPACLALVTVMQFAEGLSDRQAANAVRGRIDWKYALGLELTDPGFDASVLSEFRTRLLAGQAEATLFELMLSRFREAGLLKARGQQRTDSTHVLAAIQTLNRLECVGETMRQALNVLAVVAPDWLRGRVPVEWFDRYGPRFAEYRLPAGRPERYALAETIRADGGQLLHWIYASSTPPWFRDLPAVEVLRQVWVQQFYLVEGVLRWRQADDLPPSALMICSPYDAEARYSKQRGTEWTGYRAHLTETCDAHYPHLITDVQTTPAPVSDFDMLPTIQAALATREVLPAEHLVDAGYVTADHLVASQKEHDIILLGPVNPDTSWQAKAQQGFDVASFMVDWDAHTVTCPHGRKSVQWVPGHDCHAHPVIHIRFARTDCQACPARAHCTQAASQPRTLTIRPRDQHEALQAARQRQTTEEFKQEYARRAGVEGTISQAVRTAGWRRARYIGLAKTHLQNLITAAALNLLRVAAWLAERPHAPTRLSPFAALARGST